MPSAPSSYDYRQSTVHEDRERAQEVWDRVEGDQRREKQREPPQQQQGQPKEDGHGGRDKKERENAARVLQSRYRFVVVVVLPPLVPCLINSREEVRGKFPSSLSAPLTLSPLARRTHVTHREAQGRNLTSSQRWEDGMRKRKLNAAGEEQHSGTKNDPSASLRPSSLSEEKRRY
jgi:hypothetical protein